MNALSPNVSRRGFLRLMIYTCLLASSVFRHSGHAAPIPRSSCTTIAYGSGSYGSGLYPDGSCQDGKILRDDFE